MTWWRDFLCSSGWHHGGWSKWETVAEGNMTEEGRAVGKFIVQRKSCTFCGIQKYHYSKADLRGPEDKR